MSRRARVWVATPGVPGGIEVSSLVEMVELGTRAWYALVTGDKGWMDFMSSGEPAPESAGS